MNQLHIYVSKSPQLHSLITPMRIMQCTSHRLDYTSPYCLWWSHVDSFWLWLVTLVRNQPLSAQSSSKNCYILHLDTYFWYQAPIKSVNWLNISYGHMLWNNHVSKACICIHISQHTEGYNNKNTEWGILFNQNPLKKWTKQGHWVQRTISDGGSGWNIVANKCFYFLLYFWL